MELGTAIGLLFVIVSTFAFEGIVYGNALVEESFALTAPAAPSCTGFLDGVACALGWIVQVFQAIAGALVFLFNLLTFNIPDAPIPVRIVLAAVFDGGLLLLIVSIFRGN